MKFALLVFIGVAACTTSPAGTDLRSVRIDLRHLCAVELAPRLSEVLDPFCCWDVSGSEVSEPAERCCIALRDENAILLRGKEVEIDQALQLVEQLDRSGMSPTRGEGAMLLANYDYKPTEVRVQLRRARATDVAEELRRTLICHSQIMDASGKRLPCEWGTWFHGEVDEESNSIRVWGPRVSVRDTLTVIRMLDE